MMKHEQQISRIEKKANFFGTNNFSRLNLYLILKTSWENITINLLLQENIMKHSCRLFLLFILLFMTSNIFANKSIDSHDTDAYSFSVIDYSGCYVDIKGQRFLQEQIPNVYINGKWEMIYSQHRKDLLDVNQEEGDDKIKTTVINRDNIFFDNFEQIIRCGSKDIEIKYKMKLKTKVILAEFTFKVPLANINNYTLILENEESLPPWNNKEIQAEAIKNVKNIILDTKNGKLSISLSADNKINHWNVKSINYKSKDWLLIYCTARKSEYSQELGIKLEVKK